MGTILNIYKPSGITSYDVIRFLKKRFPGIGKIGHAGTLDPLAEGVLVVCTGSATKLTGKLALYEKEYIARMIFGVKTDTDDIDGRVLEKRDVPDLSYLDVEEILDKFRGTISQVPPVVSAIKYRGKPMYKHHRQGRVIVPEARTVSIKEIELLSVNMPEIQFRVVCSKGTYIRALCRDIGVAAGCLGTQTGLKRTRVGSYRIEKSSGLEDITESMIRGENPQLQTGG